MPDPYRTSRLFRDGMLHPSRMSAAALESGAVGEVEPLPEVLSHTLVGIPIGTGQPPLFPPSSALRMTASQQVEVYSESDPDHKFGTLETDENWHLSFCRAQDGLVINLDDDNELDRIMTAIYKRRNAQDAKHGGPAHDDTHTQVEWCHFIAGHNWEAYHNSPMQDEREMAPDHFEDKMFDVAALAVAAIQSSRRKRA